MAGRGVGLGRLFAGELGRRRGYGDAENVRQGYPRATGIAPSNDGMDEGGGRNRPLRSPARPAPYNGMSER